MRLLTTAAAAALAVAALAAAPALAGDHLELSVVSSPPQYVSGGDARVEVAVPEGTALSAVRVTANGADVTSAFAQDPEGTHQLEGVVTGLPLGASELEATAPGPGKSTRRTSLALTNWPSEGPIFSGPRQAVFKCTSAARLAAANLTTPGSEPTCSIPTQVDWVYRATDGSYKPYTPGATRPMDMTQTTTTDGKTVDFVVRWERGTIDRFVYSIAMLSPATQTAAPDLSAWNGALLFKFEGGVAIGHTQGRPQRDSMLYTLGLSQGYAVAYSTGTVTATHYNLQLGGETAIMVKDRFVSAYGEPRYTVAVGGSGGAIQQYVYGQNHPGLLDAAIPQYSYPDMVTQTIHVGDCELLERWADQRVLAEGPTSMWRNWLNRSLIEGLNASNVVPNPYAALQPWMPQGSDECINGWRGLSPLALNPWYGTAEGVTPQEQLSTEWTHWADLVNIYGTDASGYARVPWDNVGVQYGLQALVDGKITPAQFLDLNANVGSWKQSKDMVQEGCPFVGPCTPETVDVWSARNMNLSPDGGATPAPRREGDREAMYAAYRSGMVFRGKIDIPIIDWRHYLEDALNMHNTHQSFAARQRMLNYDGDASNQVIWFTDARPSGPQFDQTPMALAVMDEWMRNIAAHPERSVAENRPAAAVDSCFATNGTLIARGDGVWNGILDGRPAGTCTQAFPLHSTSRIVAGGPIEGGVFKCALQSVDDAIDRGLYGGWHPTAAEKARLEQIFPTGVCDYRKRDLGLPPELHGNGK